LAIGRRTRQASSDIEHGDSGAGTGSIEVNRSLDGDRGSQRLVLNWFESASTLLDNPAWHGFGTEVTRMQPYELKGEAAISFDPDGFRYHVHIPSQPVEPQALTRGPYLPKDSLHSRQRVPYSSRGPILLIGWPTNRC